MRACIHSEKSTCEFTEVHRLVGQSIKLHREWDAGLIQIAEYEIRHRELRRLLANAERLGVSFAHGTDTGTEGSPASTAQ